MLCCLTTTFCSFFSGQTGSGKTFTMMGKCIKTALSYIDLHVEFCIEVVSKWFLKVFFLELKCLLGSNAGDD